MNRCTALHWTKKILKSLQREKRDKGQRILSTDKSAREMGVGGGSRYEDWIHSSRSTIFLSWRFLKIYLHGIVYKTKHLSNGCKQQIDNKYRKKAGQYLYCNVTGVFFKWNTSITIQSGWCLFSLLLYFTNFYTQFLIIEIHVVSSKIKSTKFTYVIFSSLEIYILIKYWFKKYITTISNLSK